ncbi:MAG: DNA primase [Planctomycetota bacterium]
MSHGPADDAKEQIRQATDIVDLVGSYLPLQRQGRNFVGLCPWHDDTRPSMQVNPERQTFKCWVCDIGGDVFSFLMRIDGLEFREALEALAERAGISLAPTRGPAPQPGGPGDKKTLLAAAAWAEAQFARCLKSEPGAEPARAYLSGRGISAESVDRFRVGFAPDRWDWLLSKAPNAGFSPAVLERIGLVRPRTNGSGHYDFYRGRVMFPIRDPRGRPIAFGGRILPELAENAGGKYINSPETPLFSKSNQLYALDVARDGIASSKRVVVTEGYTDVIMAHQHGVTNVVAVLGTALGEKHIPLLRRYSDSIVLVLDGDEAGQRRTNEVLELFVRNQIDLRILGLPAGLDPCDFIASPKDGRGPDAFLRLVESAPDAFEHKMRTVTKGLVTAGDTHASTRAVEAILGTLASAHGGAGRATSELLLREQNLLSRLSRKFQMPEEALRQRLAELRRGAASKATRVDSPHEAPTDEPAPRLRLDHLPPREAELLELLLAGPEHARRVIEHVAEQDLSTGVARRVLSLCRNEFQTRGEVSFGRLMDAADEALKSLLVEVDEARQTKHESNLAQRVADLLAAFAKQKQDHERRRTLAELRDGELTNQQETEKLDQFFAKLKNRQTGSPSTDG